ncbi:hypothetical protein BJX65DRAFT_79713 [Aspergillus insuetus]
MGIKGNGAPFCCTSLAVHRWLFFNSALRPLHRYIQRGWWMDLSCSRGYPIAYPNMDELPGGLSHDDVRLRFLASIGQSAQSVGGNRYIALAHTPEVHRRVYAPAFIPESLAATLKLCYWIRHSHHMEP